MNDRQQPARRKRNRSRNRGASNSNSGGRTAQKSGRSGQAKPAPKVDPREFWGDPEQLPDRINGLKHPPDVRAAVRSLGRPPLAGNETAAEHWFSLVYERAAFLSGALAAAGDLDADAEDDD